MVQLQEKIKYILYQLGGEQYISGILLSDACYRDRDRGRRKSIIHI